jgi:hypothetical protein
VAEGDDQLGDAGPQGLARRADAALVDDRAGAREHFRIRRVVEGRHARGQSLGRAVPGLADEEQGARAERPGRPHGVAVKVARRVDRRRAEREDDGRLAGAEEFEECGIGAGPVARAVAPVVEGEARDERVRRPVGLRFGQHLREEGEDERRRVLRLQDGVAAARQADLLPEPVDGLDELAEPRLAEAQEEPH